MAFPLIRMRQGDSLPLFSYSLTNDGVAVNLATASSVYLHLLSRDRSSGTKSFVCTVVSASSGSVQHVWTAEETATLLGDYYGEVEVVFADGSRLTSPTGGYIRFLFTEQLDGLSPNQPPGVQFIDQQARDSIAALTTSFNNHVSNPFPTHFVPTINAGYCALYTDQAGFWFRKSLGVSDGEALFNANHGGAVRFQANGDISIEGPHGGESARFSYPVYAGPSRLTLYGQTGATIKFPNGTLLTTPENGVMEYDGAHLFFTHSGNRVQLSYNPADTAVFGGLTVGGNGQSGTINFLDNTGVLVSSISAGSSAPSINLGNEACTSARLFLNTATGVTTLKHDSTGFTISTLPGTAEAFITFSKIRLSSKVAINDPGSINDTLVVRTPGQGYLAFGGPTGRTLTAYDSAGSIANFDFGSSMGCSGIGYFNKFYDYDTNQRRILLNSSGIAFQTAATSRFTISDAGVAAFLGDVSINNLTNRGNTPVSISAAGSTTLALVAGDIVREWTVTVTAPTIYYLHTLSMPTANLVTGALGIVRVNLPGLMRARIDLRTGSTLLDSAIDNHVARTVVWRLVYNGSSWDVVSRTPTVETFPFSRTLVPCTVEGGVGTDYWDWRLPARAASLLLTLVGGGGGGGSGMRGAAATNRFGGSGGCGGGRNDILIPMAGLPSTRLRITVGAGGTGGAAPTTDSTAGNAGTYGGGGSTVSVFNAGETAVSYKLAASTAGVGGNPGGAALANGVGMQWHCMYPSDHGVSSTTSATPVPSYASPYGPSTGGSGAGVDSSNVAGVGGAANTANSSGFHDQSGSTTAGGAATGAPGTDATAYSSYDWVARPSGRAGSGGGGNAAGGGGRGGDGGFPGGGGGGAGGGLNGYTGGRGGNGADGCVILTVYF